MVKVGTSPAPCRLLHRLIQQDGRSMRSILYVIGVVVVILVILSLLQSA